jgi:putative ABC transport system permease protein
MTDWFAQDLRYAVRSFIRNPGFAALAVATIAIGVGANTAIFTIVNTVLLRPLPFADPSALVLVSQVNRQTKQGFGNAAPANVLDWRLRNRSFSGMAAFRDESYTLSSSDQPERVGGGLVTANFFDVLGVAPALGRRFEAADERPGALRVTILSDRLWKRRFGGRADAIGQAIRLNDEPHTIVGIMPAGIDYPDAAALWTPPHWRVPDDPLAANADPSPQRDHAYLLVIARIKTGMTLAQARADMDNVASSLERDYPDSNQNTGAALVSLRDDLVGNVRPTLLLLFAAVGILLLIATVNVAGLLIARAGARHQEMAVRIALGATRQRIAAQLLTESLLLALVGGACGVLLSMWILPPLVSLSPRDLGIAGDVHLDVTVLLFALGVSMLAGLLFGMLPVRQFTDLRVYDDLKQSARGSSGVRQRRVRGALVIAEIALSLMLLVGAGLTIKSFVRLQRVPTGFDADGLLTFIVNLPPARYRTPEERTAFWDKAMESLRRVGGVDTLAATTRLPLSGGNSTRGLMIDGHDLTPPAGADYRAVTPDYFRTLRIPIVQGRPLSDDDRANRPLVTVVSASMAALYWPGVDPVGHRLSIDDDKPMTIVGVVGDVRHTSLEAAPRPTFYVPYGQDPWSAMTFALRSSAPLDTLKRSVQLAIWQVDKDQPVGAIRTMDEVLYRSLSRRRFSVTLLTAFGVIAVSLAAIGLYGVLAFIVAQRRREIGVRMALGATPRAVVADVLGEGLRLAGIGVVAGIGLAIAATRLLNALLFGTSRTDVATFSGVAVLLVVIAAAASLVPALRASRVDPIVALRDE